jgi:hypothetical protein
MLASLLLQASLVLQAFMMLLEAFLFLSSLLLLLPLSCCFADFAATAGVPSVVCVSTIAVIS